MKKKHLLAFDLGASSGRGIAGEFDGKSLVLKEVCRFDNIPARTPYHYFWNLFGLLQNILHGMGAFRKQYGAPPDSIGFDTWGVDFALLDRKGELLQNPVCYRDERSAGMDAVCFSRIPQFELYEKTGIASQPFNTLYHLLGTQVREPWILENARTLLLMPDALNYLLTGSIGCELSNASTTQLLQLRGETWAWDVIGRLGLPGHIFPEIYKVPDRCGVLLPGIREELGWSEPVPTHATGTHDTASAALALPTGEKSPLLLSSGTWSLLGILSDRPVVVREAMDQKLTNERTADGRYRVLRNIMGMWLVNECRRSWKTAGLRVDFEFLDAEMRASRPFGPLIDPDHESLFHRGNMVEKIAALCTASGQTVPATQGAYMRCISESLALKYKHTVLILSRLTGIKPGTLNIIGGGVNNRALNQMTSDATGLQVVCGSSEATAMGNLIGQLRSAGEIANWEEASQVAVQSSPVERFEPRDSDRWEEIYRSRYLAILNG